MNVILQNPFRVLGLFSNSPERTIQRQLTKINLHAGIGKTIAFDGDFPALGTLSRTPTAIQEASSQLEQGKRKAFYALFWFINNSPVDEIAFEHLRLDNIQKAFDVWGHTVKGKPITGRNLSSVANYSTLMLWYAINLPSFNSSWFKSAMEWKRSLIESNEFDEFIVKVAGENTILNKDLFLKDFIQESVKIALPYQQTGQLNRLEIIRAFETFPTEAKQALIESFTVQPQKAIEKSINQAKAKRAETPGDGEIYGEELYNDTFADLQFLKEAWGNNLQYQLLTNKVAEEIRLCVYDFFAEYRDSDGYDPGEAALAVINLAQEVGPTGQYESRVDEMADFLQDWIDEKPEREKAKKLGEPIGFITEKIEKFQNAKNSIETAKALITNCKPKLNIIRNLVGNSDELYLSVSSAVANNAMGMLVAFINQEQDDIQRNVYKLVTFPQYTTAALGVQKIIASLDLTNEVRTRVQDNFRGLKNLHAPFVNIALNRLKDAEAQMARIMEWQFGRSSDTKAQQVKEQNAIITNLKQELQTLQAALV